MKADPISGDIEAARLRDRVKAMQRALSPQRARYAASVLARNKELHDELIAYAKAAEEPE